VGIRDLNVSEVKSEKSGEKTPFTFSFKLNINQPTFEKCKRNLSAWTGA
jgi:hypothetical protein